MNDKIRLMIVDDHVVVRKGYTFMLMNFDDIKIVGEVDSGEQAIEECSIMQPDVVLMDIHLPVMSGIETIASLISTYSDLKIIALTSFESDPSLVQQALEAGAKGFVYKTVSTEDLVDAIRKVSNDQPYLSPEATTNLIQTKIKPQQQRFDLTPREREVLIKLMDGLTNAEIAQSIQLSLNTVKFHVRNILQKLNASTRTEAVSIAITNNILDQ